jgi:hypothetical protein
MTREKIRELICFTLVLEIQENKRFLHQGKIDNDL